MRFRKFGLALVIALVAAFAVTAAPAFADENTPDGNAAQLPSHGINPDPQTTNIPYVGWLGNQLKVVKCLRWDNETTPTDIAAAEATLGVSVSFPGRFQIEDWTGVDENNAGPKWHNGDVGDGGTTVPVEISESGICWSAHVSSNKPGMAVIKLAVSAEVLASLELRFGGLLLDIGPVAIFHDVLLKHQFLAIWLQSQTPVINEVAANQPGGNLEDGSPVGDPAGDGVFTPPFDLDLYHGDISNVFGVVKAQVKGTFPFGNDFAGQFKSVVTLPDDWKGLAELLAVDDTSALGGAPGSASMRWDIHDNRLSHALGGDDAAFHSTTASCNSGDLIGTDAVDNCWSGSETGPFSRVNGATWWTVGPFDALFPDQTLLNDGVLDADDAPMPPIRVDFAVSAGSIGAFAKADKDDVYDADNTDDQRHDLYAPFYESYIPAAGLGGRDGGSGVAGSFANNYPGFIDHGKYDFWSTYSPGLPGGLQQLQGPERVSVSDPDGRPAGRPCTPTSTARRS